MGIVAVFCDDGGAVDPAVTWHILIASIWQLPTAAGDSRMFARSICGAGAGWLEHDAAQAAIAKINASVPARAILEI
ncbi:MAG: hypothetical protein WBQ86_14200 [Candidatus Binatus sp.]